MIAILSCVWQRPERLRYTLHQLSIQTYTDFVLVLINNNPDLVRAVDEAVGDYSDRMRITTIHSERNRGPFARIEHMVNLAAYHPWFVTIDDDAIFGNTWLASWWAQRDETAVQGWQGWRFVGNYWQRRGPMQPGDDCHYLFGSNLMVPATAIDEGLLELPERFWQCDDLWLCYYANHVKGLALRKANIDLSINIDGKDTYTSQIDTKVECLGWLRAKGWQV